jgi:hypothetical protein
MVLCRYTLKWRRLSSVTGTHHLFQCYARDIVEAAMQLKDAKGYDVDVIEYHKD